MDEHVTPADTEAAPTVDETGVPGNVRALPAWAQMMIRDLRQENAGRRAEIKRLKAETAQHEQERQSERAALDALTQERDGLKPHAERAAVLDGYVREALEKRVAALPERYRTLIPAYGDPLETLRWLEANASFLNAPRPPLLDAGIRGDSPAVRISAAERSLAAKLGISPEQYAKAKQER